MVAAGSFTPSDDGAQGTSLADYEALASSRLDANARAYFDGGAASELTLRWNRDAFDRLRILPRVLTPRSSRQPGAGTRRRLFGRDLAHPIIVAPVAFQRLAHPEGERAIAMGAGAQDAMMVLSSLSSVDMAEAAAVSPTCRWFQLYFQPSRAATAALVARAERAAYELLVVTVDAPVNGIRDREMKARFRLPSDVAAVNLAGLPAAPRLAIPEEGSVVLDGLMALAPSWDDVTWLQSITRLPIVLKGILAPDDAARAADIGVAGIVVSNHGGRTLDTAPASIEALPDVVARVAGRLPVLLDGGIRRGTDVIKALALGADAVLVGRPVVHGLAVGGARGVSHVLRILRDEFEVAMALSGCHTLDDILPRLVMR